MKHAAILVLLIIALSLTAVAAHAGDPRNEPPIANNDEIVLSSCPMAIVDIPVLDNDFDPEGRNLRVTRVSLIKGGQAVISDGKIVRVTIDWLSDNGDAFGLVAHGAYFVSDGLAESKAEWFVCYWPESHALALAAQPFGCDPAQ